MQTSDFNLETMTYEELSIEQMKQAIELDKFTVEMPYNAMTRLKLHAEVGRLYSSSMQTRKMRKDLLQVEVKFEHKQYKSKIICPQKK